MKPTFKTLILGASILSLGLGVFATANRAIAANSGSSEYVEYVDLNLLGVAPTINIQNKAANKHINALDLKVQESSITYDVAGSVKCKGFNVEPNLGTAYFGPLAMGGFENLITTATLYHEGSFPVADVDDKIVESGNNPFVIPLNQIKNGNPALKVDALAELEKARQAFNGTDLEFFKHDREIVIQRPISFGVTCAKKTNPNKSSAGFETEMGVIHIKYKGDPALNDTPVVKAQIANNMPNQVQAGESPLKITSMTFQPNMPHHIGACPGSKTIRVNYMGQGEGEIKIRVTDGGQTIYQSGAIAYNGGQQHHDFEMSVPAAAPADLNKTVSHDLKVHVLEKDDDANVWPTHYQLKDQKEWKHRCTPQLNPNLGGNGGIGGYKNDAQGGNATQLDKIQAQPVKPARAKIGR